MIRLTSRGLYCPSGNFHIDPKAGVENAVVTHAHSDHARRGAQTYYCVRSGVGLLRARLGKKINVKSYDYGEIFQLGSVELSFHSAGHILGSCQVRLQCGSEVWVASGDYKRDPDPTCEPFETVTCDTFITEATFGTPAYAWDKSADMGREIHEWWNQNAADGYNSVLFAYSLGKTQRVLGLLEPHSKREVFCHPAAREINECYRAEGIRLVPTVCLSKVNTRIEGGLILAPPSFLKSPEASILGHKVRTAFASGWMSRGTQWGRGAYDKGFALSDHADWNDLVRTVRESRAKNVYVQHRGSGALVRHLRGLGLRAYPESDLLMDERETQLEFF